MLVHKLRTICELYLYFVLREGQRKLSRRVPAKNEQDNATNTDWGNESMSHATRGLLKADRNHYVIKVLVAAAIYLVFKIAPPPAPITEAGMEVAGLFICAIYCWLTLSVGWTSMAIIFMLATTGIYSMNQVLQHSLGHSVTTMVLFCLMINYVLRDSGVLRRIAIWILTRPFSMGSPWTFFAMYCLAVFLVG